jgi:aspartate aminotransferase-like enzyme
MPATALRKPGFPQLAGHAPRHPPKVNRHKYNTIFSAGHGQSKHGTFRIAHMGDITIDEVKELCGWTNDEIR